MAPFLRVLLLVTATQTKEPAMEFTDEELNTILSALFDRISDDDLPADEMKKALFLHNKIGRKLFNL